MFKGVNPRIVQIGSPVRNHHADIIGDHIPVHAGHIKSLLQNIVIDAEALDFL